MMDEEVARGHLGPMVCLVSCPVVYLLSYQHALCQCCAHIAVCYPVLSSSCYAFVVQVLSSYD